MQAITDTREVSVLADPPVPGAPAGQWWPPVALTPAWIDAHAGEVDVLHVHFGLESFSAAQLRAALDAARRHGIPVVYTVHDLDNPQLTDQQPYTELLDVLIPAADELLTLTPGAAAEIHRRWGREARVLPHPTLRDTPPAGDAPDEAVVRVGIHLRDLRPNIAAEDAVRAAVGAARLWPEGGRPLHVDVVENERVRDDRLAERVAAVASEHPAVHLRRTPRLDDAAVEAWISGLDLFVLPYHHGTHSGWVELCHDLGVRVAGTMVGHVGEQHPEGFSRIDLADPRTLLAAVTAAVDEREPTERRVARLGRRYAERLDERRAVRAAHIALYSALSAGVRA